MKQEKDWPQGRTNRGFEIVNFEDEYNLPCSIQESSRAVCENADGSVDDPLGWIWLGIDDGKPEILGREALKLGMKLPEGTEFLNGQPTGWVPYPLPKEVLLHTRMHLNEKQVRRLVKHLQHWLDTGSILAELSPSGEGDSPSA